MAVIPLYAFGFREKDLRDLTLSQPSFNTYIRLMRIYMDCFVLGVNIKYMLFSILYGHINVPVACKEISVHRTHPLVIFQDPAGWLMVIRKTKIFI